MLILKHNEAKDCSFATVDGSPGKKMIVCNLQKIQQDEIHEQQANYFGFKVDLVDIDQDAVLQRRDSQQ